MKIIPEFGGAGNIFKFTVLPVCIPTPEKDILSDTVDCERIDIRLVY